LCRADETRGHPQQLQDLVDELFTGSLTSDRLQHRRQCMRSFSALVPLLQQRGAAGEGQALVLAAAKTYMEGRAGRGADAVRDFVVAAVEHDAASGDGDPAADDCPAGDGDTGSQARLRWTEQLSAWLDSYNWLVKMQYVTAADLLLSPHTSSGAASTPSSKKRKAAEHSQHGGGPAVLQRVSNFLSRLQQGQSKQDEATEECLYRTLLFLGTAFASASLSGQLDALVEHLAGAGVWGAALHTAVGASLLPVLNRSDAASGSLRESSASRFNTPLAAQKLYQLASNNASALRNSGKVLGAAARAYIDGLLAAFADHSQVRPSDLQRLQSFHETFRASELLQTVFGAHHDRENRLFGTSLLRTVLLAHPVEDRHSTVAQRGAKRGRHSSSAAPGANAAVGDSSLPSVGSNPWQVPLIEAALDLAVQLGLPLCAANTVPEDVGLLELLQDPQCGVALATVCRDRVVDLLLSTAHPALSLLQSANLAAFLAAAFPANSSSPESAQLQSLLPQVVSTVIGALQQPTTSADGLAAVTTFISTLLDTAAKSALFARLPASLVLLLLEATAAADADSSSVVVNSAAAFRDVVLKDCLDTFSGKVASAPGSGLSLNKRDDQLVTRLTWLPYLLEGTVEGTPSPYRSGSAAPAIMDDAARRQLSDALDELAADRFPLDSHAQSSASAEGRSYFKLFRAYLAAFAQTGSVLLLGPLVPSLREGSRHRYFNLLRRAFRDVTGSLSVDPTPVGGAEQLYVSVRVLASYCAKQILDEYQDLSVKHTLFTHLLVPTLLRCPTPALVHIFAASRAATQALHQDLQFSFSDGAGAGAGTSNSAVVKQLCDILQREPHATLRTAGSDAAVAQVYLQSCAYRMLEALFDRCSLSVLKGQVTQAFVGTTDGVTGKELTQAVCRAAHKQMRAPKLPADVVPAQLTTGLYAAAFRCLTVTVAKTQTEEQFFDTFLFKEKPDEEVWERMVGALVFDDEGNVITPNVFSSASGKFPTVGVGHLGGEAELLPAPLQQQYYTARRQQRQALRSRAAASSAVGGAGYLSQFLAGSGLEASGASQLYRPARGKGLTQGATQSQAQRSGRSAASDTTGEGYAPSQYSYHHVKGAARAKGASTLVTLDADYNPSQVLSAYTAGGGGAGLGGELVPGLDDQLIYVELNDLNCAPAMACLLRALQRMEVLFGAKWEAAAAGGGGTELDMPKWLQECNVKLGDTSAAGQSPNVRLFVLRLLMNQPVASIVTPWVQHLVPAMLNCALHDLCGSDAAGGGTAAVSNSVVRRGTSLQGRRYSYVLRDLAFNLCDTWQAGAVAALENCAPQVTSLLCYLMRAFYEPDPDLLRENLLSVKGLLTLWVSPSSAASLQLQMRPVVELMGTAHAATGGAHAAASSRGSEGVRRRLAALDLTQHLLQRCRYPLLEASRAAHCCGTQLLLAVLDSVKFPRKEVMEAACELAGVILTEIARYSAEKKSALLIPECATFQKALESAIEGRLLQKAGNDNAATCLRAATKGCPAFLTRDLLMRTVYGFPRLSARTRYEYLEMLCRTSSVAGFHSVSLLRDVLAPHILPCLADLSTVVFGRGRTAERLPMVQINMLLLLRKHLLELGVEQVEAVLGGTATEGVSLCVAPQSVLQVRDAAYELLLALWQMRLAPNGSVDGGDETAGGWDDAVRVGALRKRVCLLLLNGLRDRDAVGMNEVTLPTDQPAANPAALTDIISTRYDQPALWKDENNSRVSVRRKLFNFFDATSQQHGYGLGATAEDRLHALMGDLYDPAQPQQWLQYSAFLSVSASRRSPAYSALLFRHSLSGAGSFTALEVTARRRAEDGLSNMTPLFSLERTSQAVTQQLSQLGSASAANLLAAQSYLTSQGGVREGAAASQLRPGYVRGTQQLSWTQTQLGDETVRGQERTTRVEAGGGAAGAGVAGAIRKRAGAYVDTSSTQFTALGAVAAAAPRELTQYITASIAVTASQAAEGGGTAAAGSASSSGSSSSAGAMGPPVGLPARYVTTQRVPLRFVASRGAAAPEEEGQQAGGSGSLVSRAAKYAAVAAVQAGGRLAEGRRAQERRSGGKGRVTVLRKYRQGELPDIAIRLSDILAPLQALCLLDEGTAGLVFDVLHGALWSRRFSAREAEPVDVMCGDLRRMLQASRSATAAGSNLCSALLRSSSHCLEAFLAAAKDAAQGAVAKSAAGSAGRGRGGRVGAAMATAPVVPSELLLPAELVAECAIQSSNYHGGIHVLEEQLLVLQVCPEAASLAEQDAGIAPTPQHRVGRKRPLQRADTDVVVESEGEASHASQASQLPHGGPNKRPRKAAGGGRSGAAATLSATSTADQTKRGRGAGRRGTATPAAEAEPTAASTVGVEDLPTQQAEGLTADELLEHMGEGPATTSAGGPHGGSRARSDRAAGSAAKASASAAPTASSAADPAQQKRVQHRRQDIWHHLYRLYDQLGERDVLLGLTAKLGDSGAPAAPDTDEAAGPTAEVLQQRSALTRQALDAELSGDFQEAVRIYSLLNEQADRQLEEDGAEAAAAVAQAERDLWDERSLHCLKQLCDWQQLHDCVDKVARLSLADAAQTGDEMAVELEGRELWEVMAELDIRSPVQNRLKERLLPHYLQSLLQLSCPYTDAMEVAGPAQERTKFIERLLSYQPPNLTTAADARRSAVLYELRQYVEGHFPRELAVNAAAAGQWARSRLYCEQAQQLFLSQWSALHPCAIGARRQLLARLQPLTELVDASNYYQASEQGLHDMLAKWQGALPSGADELAHWADVACERRTALQPALGRGSCSEEARAAAQVQMAALHVQTAAVAVQQGVLSAVKGQLNINNAIRKSGTHLCCSRAT
jgi:hypothetical protein